MLAAQFKITENSNMEKLVFFGCAVVFLSGCVSNQVVRTVETADYSLHCEQLQFKLADLGAKFEDAKDDSGLTGKNVGLGISFWPGISVNEVRSYKNQDSMNRLSNMWYSDCV
tara:strand:- start:123 stop:461 length:339 start_codon:yes stop_codon:yes gene_type:complete